eukprot:2248033-Pyramimonas_sp.AAC.1
MRFRARPYARRKSRAGLLCPTLFRLRSERYYHDHDAYARLALARVEPLRARGVLGELLLLARRARAPRGAVRRRPRRQPRARRVPVPGVPPPRQRRPPPGQIPPFPRHAANR